jgi:hypothetical protein
MAVQINAIANREATVAEYFISTLLKIGFGWRFASTRGATPKRPGSP